MADVGLVTFGAASRRFDVGCFILLTISPCDRGTVLALNNVSRLPLVASDFFIAVDVYGFQGSVNGNGWSLSRNCLPKSTKMER